MMNTYSMLALAIWCGVTDSGALWRCSTVLSGSREAFNILAKGRKLIKLLTCW